MADALSTNYGLTKPEVGASADTWGTKLNADIDALDKILGAITTTGSGAAYVLTTGQSLTAYASGQTFRIKASFTCNAAATLNVDGLGAKNITKNGTQATVSGDIVSGTVYMVSYDGTQFQVVGQIQDATLSALAALSWSSGNALVQFTAADTVSLTLAPSVSTLTASHGAGASTQTTSFANTTDNASVLVSRFDGDRATPAANDEMYRSDFLSDSAGTQVEVARDTSRATVVTAGAVTSRRFWSTRNGGTLAARLLLDAAKLGPVTNDGIALGEATVAFADLFLASGAVINFNNGNVTLTHSTGVLTLSGDLQRPTNTASPVAASVGYMGTVMVAKDVDYTIAADIFGQTLYHTSASTHTFTINSNANLALPIGFMFSIENENGGGNVTIAITTDTLRWGSLTGSRTLAANGTAYLKKVAATVWRLTGTGIT